MPNSLNPTFERLDKVPCTEVDDYGFEAIVRFEKPQKRANFRGVIPGTVKANLGQEHLAPLAKFWIVNVIRDTRNGDRLYCFLQSTYESEDTFDLGVLPAEHAYILSYLEQTAQAEEASDGVDEAAEGSSRLSGQLSQ